MENGSANFKRLLDQQYDWPADYTFRFVIPNQKMAELVDLLGDGHDLKTNSSKTGKYISIKATKNFESSEKVIEVYDKVKVISGLVSL